jgi:secretion/DNA translocation related CpaE-like protein
MKQSAPRSQSAQTPQHARPAVVTEDRELLDQLLRLCAAASVTPDLTEDSAGRRLAWARAGAVLVGDDQAAEMTRLGLSRRDNVILVSQRADPSPLWQLAVELRADHVVVLPHDQQRLIDHLSDLADGGCRARTLGVVAGRGGAGASTIAAGLGLAASRAGRQAFLLDADPLGGGIELLLGCEDAAGLRWPEVVTTQGRVGAGAFRSALPAVGSLAVLSWDATGRRRVRPGVTHALVCAAQRGSELVVVDLPRQPDEAATEALLLCDAVLLVVPSEVRAVAAARSVLAELRSLCGDIRVVVRRVPRSDVGADTVTDALELPLVDMVSHQRGLVRAVNDGLGPFARGSLERTCRKVLDAVAPGV